MKSRTFRILSSFLTVGAVIAIAVPVGRAEAEATQAPETASVGVDPTVNSAPGKQVELEQIKARYPKALTVGATDLRYIITAEGDGKTAAEGSNVSVHYRGTLWDGTVFDSSFERGQPIQFKLGAGRVIKGWDLGIEGMRVGETRILIIPYAMAYGDRGRSPSIPRRATLIFDVELVGVN